MNKGNNVQNKINPVIEFICNHPKPVLAGILIITLLFALQLPRLRLDNNNFRFIPKNDSARIIADKIESKFGSDSIIIIGLKRDFSDVLDKDFLSQVKSLTNDISAMKLVKSVVSLSTIKHLENKNDSIVSDNLVPDDYSGTEAEKSALRGKLRSWPMYNRSLVSDDLRATQIMVFLDVSNEDSGNAEASEACQKIITRAKSIACDDTKVFITGLPVFNSTVNDATASDLVVLIPLVVIVVLFVLFISFRRFTGVFLPLATVIMATIWAIGAMPLFGVRLSILSTVLPVILVAVGSAYGIHVISHYFDEVIQSDSISKEEHKNQVVIAVSRISQPVFLAALTTFAGFISFCFTSVVPIFEFGLFSSFGVLAAFVVAMTFIPAYLGLRGPKKPSIRKHSANIGAKWNKLDIFIANTFMIITSHKRIILLLMALVIAISGLGISKIVFDNVLMEYFDEDNDIIKSDSFIRDYFGGSKLLNVVISSEKNGDVLHPDVLSAMDGLITYLHTYVPDVGKVSSLTDILKRMNQVFNVSSPPTGIVSTDKPVAKASDELDAFGDFGLNDEPATGSLTPSHSTKAYSMDDLYTWLNSIASESPTPAISTEDLVQRLNAKINYDGASYYEIPTDPAKYGKQTKEELKTIIENYLMLLSGQTQGFMDDTFSPKMLKMNVQLKTMGQLDSDRVVNIIEKYVEAKFPKNVKIEVGGSVIVEKSLNKLVVNSQLISLGVSLIIVFLILAVAYKSIVAGIVGIIPLTVSILINFGIMGILGIKLNIGTAMVASFAIGIGIDYTIHYLASYKRSWLARQDDHSFLPQTFLGSGKAILFNAASVGAGFIILALSKFNILAELGILIAVTMATSSFASLTILPVILNIIKPRFMTNQKLVESVKSEE